MTKNNQNHHVIFKLFLSYTWLQEKNTKIIQNIYIFTIKRKKILERGQGLKINIRLIDQIK